MTCGFLSLFFAKHKLAPQPSRANYTSVNDELILEDAIQRITLYGNIPLKELCTGLCAYCCLLCMEYLCQYTIALIHDGFNTILLILVFVLFLLRNSHCCSWI